MVKNTRSVSMIDVGALAGVSSATVSRALTGKGEPVSDATRRKVQAAAADLGYRYNSVAASLRMQRSNLIGLVVPRIANPFFSTLVESLEKDLQEHGLELLIGDAGEDPACEATRLQRLLERRLDGVIIAPVHIDESLPALLAAKPVPIVQVDSHVTGMPFDWVGVDQRESVRAIINHLRSLEHDAIVYIGPDLHTSTAFERVAAFRQQLPGQPVFLGGFDIAFGADAAGRVLDRHPETTAIICANDLLAYGAIRRLAEIGVSVPHRMSVTGFDDSEYSSLIHPRLSTLHQPIEQISHAAVARLVSRMSAPEEAPTRTFLSPAMVPRQSTCVAYRGT